MGRSHDKYVIGRRGNNFYVERDEGNGRATPLAVFYVNEEITEYEAYEHACIFAIAMKKSDEPDEHMESLLKQWHSQNEG